MDDPAFAAVRVQFYLDFIADKHSDAMHSHLSSQIRQYLALIFEFYPEERVGERFGHDAHDAWFVLVCH